MHEDKDKTGMLSPIRLVSRERLADGSDLAVFDVGTGPLMMVERPTVPMPFVQLAELAADSFPDLRDRPTNELPLLSPAEIAAWAMTSQRPRNRGLWVVAAALALIVAFLAGRLADAPVIAKLCPGGCPSPSTCNAGTGKCEGKAVSFANAIDMAQIHNGVDESSR